MTKLFKHYPIQILVCLLVCTPIYADDTFSVNNMTFSLINTKEVRIEKIDVNQNGEVIFPSEVTYQGRTFKVRSIGGLNGLFYDSKKVLSIVIPPSITGCESTSYFNHCTQFLGCTNLKKIFIEDSDDYIYFGMSDDRQKALFEKCPLEEVYIGRNIKYYTYNDPTWIEMKLSRAYASPFKEIKTLKKVIMSSHVTALEKGLFYKCEKLEEVQLSNNIREIPVLAFYGCKSLSRINFPNNLLSINHCAFVNSAISSFTHNSVETIGREVFDGCEKLTFVSINDKIKIINFSTFRNCYNLSKVIIGKSVEEIRSNAFENSSIKEIESKIIDPSKCKITTGRDQEAFSLSTFTFATLYVPYGTKNKYLSADVWKNFVDIQESIYNKIEKVNEDSRKAKGYYNTNGYLSPYPFNGVNIKTMKDGSMRKILVK